MVAIGTKKMSAKNAQAIEEHTGIPPEELEDADLEEAGTLPDPRDEPDTRPGHRYGPVPG